MLFLLRPRQLLCVSHIYFNDHILPYYVPYFIGRIPIYSACELSDHYVLIQLN